MTDKNSDGYIEVNNIIPVFNTKVIKSCILLIKFYDLSYSPTTFRYIIILQLKNNLNVKLKIIF